MKTLLASFIFLIPAVAWPHEKLRDAGTLSLGKVSPKLVDPSTFTMLGPNISATVVTGDFSTITVNGLLNGTTITFKDSDGEVISSSGFPRQYPDMEISTVAWTNKKTKEKIILEGLKIDGNVYIMNLYTLNK